MDRCLSLARNLKRLPNEILFLILYQCPKEYLPTVLLKDNYFMNRWYREYYHHHYEKWKKDNNIKYERSYDYIEKTDNGKVEKRLSYNYDDDDTSNLILIPDLYIGTKIASHYGTNYFYKECGIIHFSLNGIRYRYHPNYKDFYVRKTKKGVQYNW